MRIFFYSHYFPPEGNAPAIRTHAHCKRWARAGHEVTVVTCAPNCPDGVAYRGYRNRFYQVEEIDGVRVVRVWTWLAANRGIFRRILNYISYAVSAVIFTLFSKRPDMIIATSPQFFCGWAGALVARIRGIPSILEVRDLWPDSIAAVGAIRNPWILRFLERLEKALYATVDHIVTVGEGYREDLIAKGVDAMRISIVPNGVDLGEFEVSPGRPDLRSELGLDGKLVCAYVGTVGMASGLDVVLRAAKLLKDKGDKRFVFLVVGGGALRAKLENEAQIKGLDQIVFVGHVEPQTARDYLALADVCLVHLRRAKLFANVMPSKIFEAAAASRPILAGLEGKARAWVEQVKAGLCFEPEDEGGLVTHLEHLGEDRALRTQMGRAGRACVEAEHDRDRLARNYLHIIEAMCPLPVQTAREREAA